MPESIKNLLQRITDQTASSGERCVASGESIALTTNVVVLSRQVIAESRARIAQAGQPAGYCRLPLSHVDNR